MTHPQETPIERVAASKYPFQKITGLGDAVAIFAQPIARVIDSAIGTNIQNCGGCKGRQAWLNKAVPVDPPRDA